MSKIGYKPVDVLEGVQIETGTDRVTVKGPLGELMVTVPRSITVKLNENQLMVDRTDHSKKVKSLHGLVRSLINNAVVGVTKPWEKDLEVVGTGYRVKLMGKNLSFEVGLSHKVEFKEVPGITYHVEGGSLKISGIDKQKVGEIANKIKSIRKPDAYKGKGIRYKGEVLRLKPGKKAKTA